MYRNRNDQSFIEMIIDVMGCSCIRVDDNIAYPPLVIKMWAKNVVQDRDADEDLKVMAGDLIFRYFMNNVSPLNTNNKYFIRKKNGYLILVRDRTDGDDNLHDYLIRTNTLDYAHASQKRMTGKEAKILDEVLTEHGISHSITDFADIMANHIR
jgi:hypothetical protein